MNLLPARRCFTEDPSHSSGLSFWLIGVARIADQQKYIMLSRIICGLMLSLSAHNTAFDSCKIEPAYFFERRVVGSASLYEGVHCFKQPMLEPRGGRFRALSPLRSYLDRLEHLNAWALYIAHPWRSEDVE